MREWSVAHHCPATEAKPVRGSEGIDSVRENNGTDSTTRKRQEEPQQWSLLILDLGTIIFVSLPVDLGVNSRSPCGLEERQITVVSRSKIKSEVNNDEQPKPPRVRQGSNLWRGTTRNNERWKGWRMFWLWNRLIWCAESIDTTAEAMLRR